MPFLRVFDASLRCVDQGLNKRPGAMTVYIEPWHADILSFLDMKKNRGNDELRARNLFYALWIPDILYVYNATVFRIQLMATVF